MNITLPERGRRATGTAAQPAITASVPGNDLRSIRALRPGSAVAEARPWLVRRVVENAFGLVHRVSLGWHGDRVAAAELRGVRGSGGECDEGLRSRPSSPVRRNADGHGHLRIGRRVLDE